MMRLLVVVMLCSALNVRLASAQASLADRSTKLFASWSQADVVQDSSLTPRLVLPGPQKAETRHKSPVLAWFLSWLIPGGGQGYNGQWGKAAAFFVPAAVGFTLAVSNDGFSCSQDCGTRDLGLVILAVASIGSQVEAPIAASKINREARKASQVGLTVARINF
jgi:hypothetical protein